MARLVARRPARLGERGRRKAAAREAGGGPVPAGHSSARPRGGKSYVYGLVGPLKAMGEPTNAAERGDLDLRVALEEARAAAIDRLKALTPAERRNVRKGGQSLYSAHRVIRRMLEHEWEHRREVADRLERDA